MAKPKTWTVTVEPVTGGINGLSEYGNYLHNMGHKNHTKTNVISLFGDFNHLAGKCLTSALAIDGKNRKGGPRMKSLAMSYVFSLPPVFKPSPDEWKLIAKDLIRAVTKKLDLPANKWKDFIFTNLHEQNNSHLNMVISKTFEGAILDKVDQKGMISLAKQVFTQSVATHCKVVTDDYEIVRQTPKTRPGRLPKWQYDLQLAQEAAAKNEAILAKLELQAEKVELAKKELASLLFNADAWVKAVKRKTINEEEYAKKFMESHDVLANLKVPAINQRIQNIREAAEEKAHKKLGIKP